MSALTGEVRRHRRQDRIDYEFVAILKRIVAAAAPRCRARSRGAPRP